MKRWNIRRPLNPICIFAVCTILLVLVGCGKALPVNLNALKNAGGAFALGALSWGASVQDVQTQLGVSFSWCSDAQLDLSDPDALSAAASIYCADRSAVWRIGQTEASAQFQFQSGALSDIQFALDSTNANAISAVEAALTQRYGAPSERFELSAAQGTSCRWDGADGSHLYWMVVKNGETIQQAVLTINDGIPRPTAP